MVVIITLSSENWATSKMKQEYMMAKQPAFGGDNLDSLIAAADDSVKRALSGAKGLRSFLSTIDKLSDDEIKTIVQQAIKLLENFYVHLPLKRAMHAVDPLQRLRLLERRLPQMSSEITFHHEMTDIFTSLRDLHTNYILPEHFSQMVAFLPFRVEACISDGRREYIVSEVMQGFNHPTFGRGVVLTYWNGIPIERAVEIAASRHGGSNSAARHARGVAGLTKRGMNIAPPPDEEWVVIRYVDLQGQAQEFQADWTITNLPADADAGVPESATEASAACGLDLEGDTFRRINKMLFAQHLIAAQRQVDSVRQTARQDELTAASARGSLSNEADLAKLVEERAAESVQGTDSTMPEVFAAKSVTVSGRSYSYIRIFTFSVQDDTQFINEFLRLISLSSMPKDGLIIDVRSNGGGLIWAGERLLQLLTPRTIEPCRLQFINTSANLLLCNTVKTLKDWKPSLERALETGAIFSAGFPITSAERCNDIGQRYYGPVVLVTDARCYSTTDIFAAGFQDHEIGTILGVDDNTGAGGANVWTLDLIRNFFGASGVPAPLQALPRKASMRVAIRRTLRVGKEIGTELEDLGVKPDERHEFTRADALDNNRDLIARAADIISRKTAKRAFEVNLQRIGEKLRCTVETTGVEHLDVFVGRRPRGSWNVSSGTLTFDLPQAAEFILERGAVEVEMRGYTDDQLVCARRIKSPP